MKILFTQHGLRHRGGSELFVVEVVRELARRGHEVAVYTGDSGPMASILKECGVMILDDPTKCPWMPDIIHGQHHQYALRAILGFPMTPAILYLHGFVPALEKPFRHPRILRYLTIAEGISRHWSSSYALPPDLFLTIPNHIDLGRFHHKRSLPDKPAKALIFANALLSQEQLEILQNACTKRGMTLELAGLCSGPQGMLLQPENHLPQYDLVFAVGRSALEAAACGCGVIPVYRDMAEEILLPETYEKLRAQNLAPRLLKHHKLSEEWIEMQLDRWNSNLIMEVSEIIRESAGVDNTVSLLEKTYAAVCQEYSIRQTASWEEEREALEAYFGQEGELHLRERISKLRAEISKLTIKMEKLESMKISLLWKFRGPVRWTYKILGRGNHQKPPETL